MKIREGVKLRWKTPNGVNGEATVKRLNGYVKSQQHGKSVDFLSDTGFRTIALDWVTHINKRKVRRKRK